MKKAIFVLFVLILFSFASCSKNDSSSTISTTAVTNTVVSGTWKIIYYWDSDHEETANYSGYNFTFASGNTLTATKTGSSVTGTWSTLDDDSKTKLVLVFSTPTSFVEISEDWHVIERTDSRIKLQHISGGNGGTDYLTFEKN